MKKPTKEQIVTKTNIELNGEELMKILCAHFGLTGEITIDIQHGWDGAIIALTAVETRVASNKEVDYDTL